MPSIISVAGSGMGVEVLDANAQNSPSGKPATGGSGSTGTLGVTAGSGCGWGSSSAVPWITVTGSGTGTGSAAYSVAANTSTASRSGAITVAGTSFTVTQAGAACSYSVTPTTQIVGPAASDGSVQVSSLTGCSWTTKRNASWITVLSGGTGSSSGAVTYRVAATSMKRAGSITVASNSIAVLQNGTSAPRGAVALSPAVSTVTQPFTLSGWAVDLGAVTGTGVSVVHVYAYPNGTTPAVFLGAAQYGQPRNDIGTQFGAQYTNSGYSLTVSGLATGKKYKFVAYARSTLTGVFTGSSVTATIASAMTVASLPRLAVDTPKAGAEVRQPFYVSGWAIDQAATTGTGVSAVLVHARLAVAGSPLINIGQASYGILRKDVGSYYGSRFARSGYSRKVTGLAPGVYDLTVSLRSAVTNTITKTVTVRITIVP